MPKKHVDNLLECDDETAAHLIQVIKSLAKRIQDKTGAPGINILNNNGEAAGQTVNHLHFHIIPRYSEKMCIRDRRTTASITHCGLNVVAALYR